MLLPHTACRHCFFLIAFVLIAWLAVFGGAPTAVARGPQSVADLVEKLQNAVVNISTSQKLKGRRGLRVPQAPDGSPFSDFFDDFFDNQAPPDNTPPRQPNALGSGFIVDARGIVITNYHVVDKADEITVVLTDGTKMPAEVIGKDKETDLAVLKVTPAKPLQAVSFGDSEQLRVGDWVMAIGNPFALGGSVTVGVVSARGRNLRAGAFDDFIQTDAAINRGNSGGPLFNMDGEVVGINTAIISPTGVSIGLGFAVPASLAIPVIGQLREFGETRRGWLGVNIQRVSDDIAENMGLERARGALIADVVADGPAQKAGLLPGDVILNFDGTVIDEMHQLSRVVALTPVGRTVAVEVLRKGARQTITVTLGRLEDGEAKPASLRAGEGTSGDTGDAAPDVLGLDLRAISPDLRKQFSIDGDADGIVIVGVAPDSDAARKGLKAGDVIVEVAQEAVKTPQELRARIRSLREGKRGTALLLIVRANGRREFIALRLDTGDADAGKE